MDQTARLRYLKQVILACPEDYLDFDDWGRTVHIDAPPEIYDDLMAGGTVVCPLGLASLDPVFQKLGLRPRWDLPIASHEGTFPLRFLHIEYVVPNRVIEQKYVDQEAAKMFFGLSHEQMEDIFQHSEDVATTIGEIDSVLTARGTSRKLVEQLARDFAYRALEVAGVSQPALGLFDFDAFLQWLVLTRGDSMNPEYRTFLEGLHGSMDSRDEESGNG